MMECDVGAAAGGPTDAPLVPCHEVLSLDEIVEGVCDWLLAPRDLLAAGAVCSRWRAAVGRVLARRAAAMGPHWPSALVTVGPAPKGSPPASRAAEGEALGKAVAGFVERCGIVPSACLVFYLDTTAAVTPPAQRAFDDAIVNALPPTCVLAGSAAEAIVCGDEEVVRRGLPSTRHCAAVMLVPRHAGVAVSADVVSPDLWAEDDGVDNADVRPDFERLSDRFFTRGLTSAIVSHGTGYEVFGHLMEWFNEDPRARAGVDVAGAFTGARGRHPLVVRDNGPLRRCEGVLLLNISPDPARTHCVSLGCDGDQLTPEMIAEYSRVDAGAVPCAALSYSCVGRFGWKEPAALRELSPGLPVVGFYGQGELGTSLVSEWLPQGAKRTLRQFAYTNFLSIIASKPA